MSNRHSVFILLLAFLTGTAHAQDSTSGHTGTLWTLQSCLDYAKKYNIQLNTLRLTEKSAEQNYQLSKAARQPNLTGGVGLTYTHNGSAAVNSFQQSSFNNNFSLSSGMTIYNGGYIGDDIRQKNLEIQSANLNILETENNITNLITAQSSVRQNKVTLKQLLQLPFQDSFDIVSPDTIFSKEAVAPLDTAVAIALRTRPEVMNAQLGIDISRLDLAKAKTGYLPLLTASAAIGSAYSSSSSSDYFKQQDNSFFQQAGLNLSIPIFTKRVVKTNVENAKIEIDQSKLNLLSTQTTLALTIEQAYINVVNAQGQYDAAVEGLKANQESFRIATEQLRVGATNIVDYLQQKTLYTQAFQVYLQAKYNAALSVRIYDFYMGIAVKL
jgi:outer membrane protein